MHLGLSKPLGKSKDICETYDTRNSNRKSKRKLKKKKQPTTNLLNMIAHETIYQSYMQNKTPKGQSDYSLGSPNLQIMEQIQRGYKIIMFKVIKEIKQGLENLTIKLE